MESGDTHRDEWFSRVCNRLDEIAKLGAGWDGYGAPPIENLNRHFAAMLLSGVSAEVRAMPFPAITPMSDGGIMIEWESATHEFTVEVRSVERS